MSDKNNHNHGINVGTSLILVAFVLICLVAFAALSFSSANSDHKLSMQTLDRKTDYINACNIAEEKLARIDEILHSCYDKTKTNNDIFSEEYIKLVIKEISNDSDISYVNKSSSEDNTKSNFSNNTESNLSQLGELTFTVKLNAKEQIKIELELISPTDISARSELFNIITYKTELISDDNITIEEPEIGYLF